MVQRPVARRADEIGPRALLVAELLAPAPHLEQHVLHDLLGQRPLAHDPLGDADERRVPGAEDRVERVLVARAQAGEQRALVGRAAWGGAAGSGGGSVVRHGRGAGLTSTRAKGRTMKRRRRATHTPRALDPRAALRQSAGGARGAPGVIHGRRRGSRGRACQQGSWTISLGARPAAGSAGSGRRAGRSPLGRRGARSGGRGRPGESGATARAWRSEHPDEAAAVDALDRTLGPAGVHPAGRPRRRGGAAAREGAPSGGSGRAGRAGGGAARPSVPAAGQADRHHAGPANAMDLGHAGRGGAAAGRGRRRRVARAARPAGGADVAGQTFATMVGTRDSVRLPDGTRVTLGPRSRSRWPPATGAHGARCGSAARRYFEVTHDARRRSPCTPTRRASATSAPRSWCAHDAGAAVEVAVTEGTVLWTRSGRKRGRVRLGPRRPRRGEPPGRAPGVARDVVTDATSRGRAASSCSTTRRSEAAADAAALVRRGAARRRLDARRARHLTAAFDSDAPARVLGVVALRAGATVEHAATPRSCAPRRRAARTGRHEPAAGAGPPRARGRGRPPLVRHRAGPRARRRVRRSSRRRASRARAWPAPLDRRVSLRACTTSRCARRSTGSPRPRGCGCRTAPRCCRSTGACASTRAHAVRRRAGALLDGVAVEPMVVGADRWCSRRRAAGRRRPRSARSAVSDGARWRRRGDRSRGRGGSARAPPRLT